MGPQFDPVWIRPASPRLVHAKSTKGVPNPFPSGYCTKSDTVKLTLDNLGCHPSLWWWALLIASNMIVAWMARGSGGWKMRTVLSVLSVVFVMAFASLFIHHPHRDPKVATPVRPSYFLSAPSRPPIVFLTHATGFAYDRDVGRGDPLCRCMESVMAAGFDYRITGWGWKFKGFRDKNSAYYLAAKDLAKRDPRTVLVVGDAHDLLFNGPGSWTDVLDYYLRHYGGKIVFGLEKNCWALDPLRCRTYPRPKSGDQRYRWLNSGFWIAQAKDAVEMLEETLKARENHFDDQNMAHVAFLSGKYNITLDYGSRLVLNMHDAEDDVKQDVHGWSNVVQNSRPFFIHHNGNGKKIFESIELNQWLYHNHSSVRHFWMNAPKSIQFGILPRDWRSNLAAELIGWRTAPMSVLCPEYFWKRQLEFLELGAED